MECNKLLPILLYLCLSGGSITFVWQTIKEYSNGATSYTETQETLSLDDIPTIVICLSFEDDYEFTFTKKLFPLTYGRDVVIYATIFEEESKTVALLKDERVPTLLGLDIHMTEMVLMRKPKWQCYKITTNWNEEDTADIQNLRIQLSLTLPTANRSHFEYHWDQKFGGIKTSTLKFQYQIYKK